MKKGRKAILILAVVIGQMLNLISCQKAGNVEDKTKQESGLGQNQEDSQEQGNSQDKNGSGVQAGEESETANPLGIAGGYAKVPQMTREEYPVVDGSTATIPLSTALYQLVTGASFEDAQRAVRHTKTTSAYMRLLSGSADLVIAYEPAQSVYDYMEENDEDMIIKPIGKDALVFMVNEGNPVTSLSGRQLMDIYAGNYKNWSEVGGHAKEIVAFQRPEGSGSQTLMEKLVMKGVPMAPAPQTYVIGEMDELIENVAAYNNQENALGYSVYFYAQNMYQKPGLAFMAVDGVMPDNESIKKGTYPYVNEFYAAVRADEPEDSNAYQLFQWLTTRAGQSFVESLGYVGVEDTGDMTESVQTQPEIEPGIVKLENDARILLDKGYLDGTEGVVVLGADLSEKQVITDKTIDPIAQAVIGSEPVIMTDIASNKQGLYSVSKDRWTLEPVYDGISFKDEGLYYTYREGNPGWISWNQEQQIYEELSGIFSQVGDCWWREDQTVCEIEIFQGLRFPAKGESPVKILNFFDCGFSYGYTMGEYYVAAFEGGNQKVYDSRGELLFDREQSVAGRSGDVYGITPGAVFVNTWDDSDSYIYNIKMGQVVTKPGDQVKRSIVCDGKGYFSVIRNGKPLICDEQGAPVFSREGQAYDRLIGQQYCGNWKDGILHIEKPGTDEHYEIPRAEDAGETVIGGNLFYLNSGEAGQKAAVYRGNECLIQEEYLGYGEYDDYCVIYSPEGEFVVDRQGNTLYEAGENEHFMGVYAGCLMVIRGNYVYIIDQDGNCGFQSLLGYMADD